MIRKIAAASLLVLLASGAAHPESGTWARITTWDGSEIVLADYGFYEGSNWDRIAEFRVDRVAVRIVYGGAPTEIPYSEVRMISQERPVFTEAFRGVVVELLDGTRFRCEFAPEVSGFAGRDQVSEVLVPGRKIRSVEFVRPAAKAGAEKDAG
jgi:hypothetical protein